MNTSEESTLEVSLPKALLISALCAASFVVALLVMGLPMPMHDPLFIGVFIVMVTSMTLVQAAAFTFMLRCKIGRDGLRPAVPGFYRRVLRWNDFVGIRKSFANPFYIVRGRALDEFCVLPRRFFLKRPDSLKQLIELYAPADNIVRRTLMS